MKLLNSGQFSLPYQKLKIQETETSVSILISPQVSRFISTLNEPIYKKHTTTIDTMTIKWSRGTEVGSKSIINRLLTGSLRVFVPLNHLPLSNLNFFHILWNTIVWFFCKSLSSLVLSSREMIQGVPGDSPRRPCGNNVRWSRDHPPRPYVKPGDPVQWYTLVQYNCIELVCKSSSSPPGLCTRVRYLAFWSLRLGLKEINLSALMYSWCTGSLWLKWIVLPNVFFIFS